MALLVLTIDVGVRDNRESASFVNFIDKIAITHTT